MIIQHVGHSVVQAEQTVSYREADSDRDEGLGQ
jgi:hypothetical protein